MLFIKAKKKQEKNFYPISSFNSTLFKKKTLKNKQKKNQPTKKKTKKKKKDVNVQSVLFIRAKKKQEETKCPSPIEQTKYGTSIPWSII